MIFIYGLCEPDTGEIRYVGQSEDPRRRFKNHISQFAAEAVLAWVDELAELEREPMLVILAEAEDKVHASALELHFIAKLRRPRLLNRLVCAIHPGAPVPRRPRRLLMKSQGAALLAEAMAERFLSQNAVSKQIGLPAGLLSRLLSGKRAPSLATAGKIAAAFGIPVTAWEAA